MQQLAKMEPKQVAADALNHGPQPAGRRKWSSRGPMTFGMLAVAVLFAVLGVWGNFATISGAIIATGMIQVESLRQVVQHPEGGVVGSINIKEGDTVMAGDVLIRFDDTLLRSQLATVEGQLDEISARRARLEAERDETETLDFPAALLERADDPSVRQCCQRLRTTSLSGCR